MENVHAPLRYEPEEQELLRESVVKMQFSGHEGVHWLDLFNTEISVVLPQPFGPTMVVMLPVGISTDRFLIRGTLW